MNFDTLKKRYKNNKVLFSLTAIFSLLWLWCLSKNTFDIFCFYVLGEKHGFYKEPLMAVYLIVIHVTLLKLSKMTYGSMYYVSVILNIITVCTLLLITISA